MQKQPSDNEIIHSRSESNAAQKKITSSLETHPSRPGAEHLPLATFALEIRIHLTAERDHTDLTTDFQFIYHIIIEMPLS